MAPVDPVAHRLTDEMAPMAKHVEAVPFEELRDRQ